MEDTELEEGEACSHRNDSGEYDASVDPDIALSYIDEKLQNVLGHFQKDFEGGVSAENLGAKFGGYGSFLPTYQRSPASSHPRTSPKVQNCSMAGSPNNRLLEAGHQNSLVSSHAPQPVRVEPTSTSSTSLPVLKAPSKKASFKLDIGTPSTLAEEVTPRYESENQRLTELSDQKTLKVRIKVGSDNLSTRKNDAIYSGLGLDVSPSSSLNDSPSGSEGMSREPQDIPFESPTTILQIMTSFPVPGDTLLSPLSHNLIHLTKKEKLMKVYTSMPVSRDGLESNNMIPYGPDSRKVGGKVVGEKKMKSLKRSDVIAELKSGNCKDAQMGNMLISRKEPDIDILACEEPVSKNLKLPLLSNSNSAVCGMEKGKDRASEISREADKGLLKDKDFSEIAKVEPLGPTFSQEDGLCNKSKAGSAGKVSEDNKESSLNDIPIFPRKAAQPNGEMSSNSVKSDSKVSKGRKSLNAELTNAFNEKPNLKDTAYEQDSMRLLPEKEHSFSGKKSNGSQSNGTLDVPKVSLRVGSSMVSKTKKSTHADHHMSKSEFEDLKILKDLGTAGNRYRNFFGELEEEESKMVSLDMPSEDKDCEVVEKSISAINNALDERSSVDNFDKILATDAYPKAEPNIGPYFGNGPVSDAAPAMGAPSVMELDTWVSCDRCHKWRLLPFPKDLPEKWLCSMLDWLPGMNRCSIPEEETTKALIALHQIPGPQSQTNLLGNPGGVLTGVMSANIWHPDQNHKNIATHSMPWGEKKKDGLTEAPDASYKVGLSLLSNSVKNLQASVKDRSLNDVNQSPLMGEPDSQQPSKSSDLPVEKHKEKQKVHHSYSDGGDANNLKMKSRRVNSDLDCSRASRKMKTEGTDEDGMSDYSEPTRKLGPSSSNCFRTYEKDEARYSERSSFKNSRNEASDGPHVSVKNAKHKVLASVDGGSLEMGKSDSRANSKKREGKELNDDDNRKEKKVRVSKSEGKESRASRDSGRTDKKDGQEKNQQLGQDPGSNLSQRSLDGVDSLRRDLGSLQPSMAATSSSSKVSGSHKTKASSQEVKGSPVESVSSSPMRISSTDKLMTASRAVRGKNDLEDAGPLAPDSPRNCSYGEDDDGSDLSGTARKEKAFNIPSHRSFGSTGPDCQEHDFCHISGGKARPQIVANPQCANGGVYNFGQDTPNASKPLSSNQCHDEERKTDCPRTHESRPRKSGKGSSSRLDKNRSIRNNFEMGKVKTPQSFSDLQDHSTSHKVKPRNDKNDFQEKFVIKFDEAQNKYAAKKDPANKLSSESSKRESLLKCEEHDGSHTKVDSICRQDVVSTTKQTLLPDSDGERSSKRFPSDRTDQVGLVSGGEKSLPLHPSRGSQIETVNRCPRPVTGSHNTNGVYSSAVVSSESDAGLMVQKQARKAEHQNGTQHKSSRNPTLNEQKARELDAPSPARKDSSSQAATNALKEAKDLKHCADRHKNSGSNLESTGFYFQAALKFLHGASLLESGSCESSKHSEIIQSKQVYSSTAKLCDFCAREYEKLKDMAAAALAYKCMEVAYLRVIYFSQSSASRDRRELLQTALQMVPPGESPSSSASDLDNLNNPTAVDKVTLCKGVSSPQIAGNHVIAARSRPNFMRLLSFAQDVNFAMEASRKSRIAFAAASVSLGETESISSIKRALDFNFQDVEGLLRLVRLAMEAINR